MQKIERHVLQHFSMKYFTQVYITQTIAKKLTIKKKPVHLNTLTNHVQTIEPKVRVY